MPVPMLSIQAAAANLGFLFLVFDWIFPWYVIPPMTLALCAAAATRPAARTARILFAFTMTMAGLVFFLYGVLGRVSS